MAGCNVYTITNTGATLDSISFQGCTLDTCGLTIYPGETYYVNSNVTILPTSELAVYFDGNRNVYLNFSGACGDNFSYGIRFGATTAFTLNQVYCFSSVTNCTGSLDYQTQCYKLYSSGVSPTHAVANIVSYPNGVYSNIVDCQNPFIGCPCPTSPCETYYCISNTDSVYDDIYEITGTYNGSDYWVGTTNGYYIYYNSGDTQWCLSETLGGSCFLFGKSPCTSECPDLCDDYQSNGICPTPTPTPTKNCDILDFEALFSCEVTQTPSNTPTTTPTPTNTPTPSATEPCGYMSVNASIMTFSPTPTTTLTPTPTPSAQVDRPFNFEGNVTFNTVDTVIQCPESKKFQDCFNGTLYYTTNNTITPSGDTLQQFMIFKAYVDNQLRCVSYLGVDTNVIGVNTITLLEGPIGYSNLGECILCSIPQ